MTYTFDLRPFRLFIPLFVAIGLIGFGSIAGPIAPTAATPSSTTTEGGTTYNVSNVGASYFSLDGDAQPTLTLERGKTYTFDVDASGHPFHITTDSNGGDFSGIYTNGVSVTGAESDRTAVQTGTLTFTVPESAPDTLYYQCGIHSGMGAKLQIVNGSETPNYESPDGEVFFTDPVNGTTVSAPVNFSMDANNFVIEAASNGVQAGHGHLHILVDKPAVPAGQQIPATEGYYHYGDGSTEAQLNLSSGQHTIVLQAGDANHTAYNLTDTIEITVSSGSESSTSEPIQLTAVGTTTTPNGTATVTYNLTNTNGTALSGPALKVTEYPSSWTIASHEDAGSTYSESSGTPTWLFLSVSAGASKQPTMTFNVPNSTESGDYTVTGQAQTADGFTVNASATVTVSESGARTIEDEIAGEDESIGIVDIQRAIRLWANDKAVPNTGGKTIGIVKIQQLIQQWASGG